MGEDMNLRLNPKSRFRFDKFGGLAWFPNGKIYKLNTTEACAFSILDNPRNINELCGLGIDLSFFLKHIRNDILMITDMPSVTITENEWNQAQCVGFSEREVSINKPFWVHIQSHTCCSLSCLACYCCGDSQGFSFNKGNLSLWKTVIDKLINYGVLDIYLTGGETLLYDESLELLEYIKENGAGSGISTNGTILDWQQIRRLRAAGVNTIQISLNSGIKKTQDILSNNNGCFELIMKNLEYYSQIFTCVINVVVTTENIDELESVIAACHPYGIREYKFMPVKNAGRAKANQALCLSQEAIEKINTVGDFLEKCYGVNIETPCKRGTCGSGFSGFSINEHFLAYPCIFHMDNRKNALGNVLTDDIDALWTSEAAVRFRETRESELCTDCWG